MTGDKIFTLIEIMLLRCEEKKFDYVVNLNQFHNDNGSIDYVYEISTMAEEETEGYFSNSVSFNLTFCFGESISAPYIMLNYSDSWNENVKVFDTERVNKFKSRIIELYEVSRDKQFGEILSKTMEYFDIEDSEIRDVKIKNLIEDE